MEGGNRKTDKSRDCTKGLPQEKIFLHNKGMKMVFCRWAVQTLRRGVQKGKEKYLLLGRWRCL